MSETNLTGAKKLAERIRAEIESHNFDPVDRLTCSFGVVEYDGSDEPFDQVIEKADKALYMAKSGGRNRVETI